jgi:putative RNA 2'-phosphotransferase
MSTIPKEIIKLGQFLSYVLGREPDEFGLISDHRGFVATKDLLKALHQESGWGHLRLAHLHQLIAMVRPSPIEIEGGLIRAQARDCLPAISQPQQLPKLLFMAIRRRAYAAALTKGLSAGSRPYLILSSERARAQKMGYRLDNEPVLLTIQVALSQTKGTCYRQYGKHLYLADTLAKGTFSGPPAPKEKAAPPKKMPEIIVPAPTTPGSYFPEMGLSLEEKMAIKRERRSKKTAQEKARRQARKNKSQHRA